MKKTDEFIEKLKDLKTKDEYIVILQKQLLKYVTLENYYNCYYLSLLLIVIIENRKILEKQYKKLKIILDEKMYNEIYDYLHFSRLFKF